MTAGTVIVLNGASSSSKAKLALALQESLDEMFLHLETDDIFELIENAGYNGPVQRVLRHWRSGEPDPSSRSEGSSKSRRSRSTERSLTAGPTQPAPA